MKGKCIYCNRKIHESNIRCSVCDRAWEDGAKHGRGEIKRILREAFITLSNLIKESE